MLCVGWVVWVCGFFLFGYVDLDFIGLLCRLILLGKCILILLFLILRDKKLLVCVFLSVIGIFI